MNLLTLRQTIAHQAQADIDAGLFESANAIGGLKRIGDHEVWFDQDEDLLENGQMSLHGVSGTIVMSAFHEFPNGADHVSEHQTSFRLAIEGGTVRVSLGRFRCID